MSIESNKIELKHSGISLRDDGIVEVQFFENSEIDRSKWEEITMACDQLLEKKKYPILHLLGKYVNFTNEARSYSASENGLKYSKAEAYVFTSFAHKLLASFYIKMNKPSVPTQFFSNEKDALTWLTTFL